MACGIQKAAVAATWFGVAGSVAIDVASAGTLTVAAVAGVLASAAGVVTGMMALEDCLETNNKLEEARALKARREDLQRELERLQQLVGH